VVNLTGATPSANLQPATATNRPPLVGRLQAKLTKTAKFITVPSNRKKRFAHAKLATGNILRVTVRLWFVLSDLTMAKGANLTGIKNVGVNASQLDKLAG
jgi:hypothetical protein